MKALSSNVDPADPGVLVVNFLGTASGLPVPQRSHSAYLVSSADDHVIIDAGEGISRAHAAYGIPFDICRRIYISHTHADHVAGLPMLIQAMRMTRRTRPLEVYAPPGDVSWLLHLLAGMHLHPEEGSFPFSVLPLDGAPWTDHEIEVTAVPNEHLLRRSAAGERLVNLAESFSFLLRHPACTVFFSSDILGVNDILGVSEQAEIIIIDTAHVPLDHIETFATRHRGAHVFLTHVPTEIETQLATRYPDTFRDSAIAVAVDGMRLAVDRERLTVYPDPWRE